MNRGDKLKQIEKANLLAEQRFVKSKGLIQENVNDAYHEIMDRHDGPVDEFVVISRAINLAAQAGVGKAVVYANALQNALNTIRKGGEIKSKEY